MFDLYRLGLLTFILISILGATLTGYLDKAKSHWGNFNLSIRVFLTILVGWPIVGYVSPTLIKLWGLATSQIVGLGGAYFISDRVAQLLLVLIGLTAIQMVVIVIKLNQIKRRL